MTSKHRIAQICANCGSDESSHSSMWHDGGCKQFVPFQHDIEGLDELVDSVNQILMPYRIKATPHPNCYEPKHRFNFATRRRISDRTRASIGAAKGENKTMDALKSINGVIECFVGPNHVQIHKSEMFEWQELLPEIICAIETSDE